MNEQKCSKCEGCGQVTTESEEPWSHWLALPLESSAAVLMGLVRPKPCPVCGGSGQMQTEAAREEKEQ